MQIWYNTFCSLMSSGQLCEKWIEEGVKSCILSAAIEYVLSIERSEEPLI